MQLQASKSNGRHRALTNILIVKEFIADCSSWERGRAALHETPIPFHLTARVYLHSQIPGLDGKFSI